MSNHVGQSPTWALWLWWVLANTAGVLLGFALRFALAPVAISVARTLTFGVTDDQRISMVIPAVGISLAIMQWLTLRRHLSQAGWWVLATLVGWFLGVAFVMTGVGVVIGDWLEYGLVGNVITFGIIGLALGITQWLILRRQVLQAGWWILASLAGWVVLALAVGKAITNKAELAEVGAIPAVITGFVLVWLLRQPVSEV